MLKKISKKGRANILLKKSSSNWFETVFCSEKHWKQNNNKKNLLKKVDRQIKVKLWQFSYLSAQWTPLVKLFYRGSCCGNISTLSYTIFVFMFLLLSWHLQSSHWCLMHVWNWAIYSVNIISSEISYF